MLVKDLLGELNELDPNTEIEIAFGFEKDSIEWELEDTEHKHLFNKILLKSSNSYYSLLDSDRYNELLEKEGELEDLKESHNELNELVDELEYHIRNLEE